MFQLSKRSQEAREREREMERVRVRVREKSVGEEGSRGCS